MNTTHGLRLIPIDAATYQRHALHASERTWSETNCYVDLWVELLHALDLDPLACAAFTLSTDFEGDQWTFFKYPPEDLRTVYGIEVSEMNAWRPIIDHVVEQIEMGRLVTMEADSWYLPDTAGVAYQLAHVKSTIVPNEIDVDGRRMSYFHNAGYYALDGDNFDGVFRLGEHTDPDALPPYVESIRLDRIQRDNPELVERAVTLTKEHLERRPRRNPMARFEARLTLDLEWLSKQDIEMFHLYAFGTCRQCGASAELAGSFVDWLAERDRPHLGAAGVEQMAAVGEAFRSIATQAKSLEFGLARLSRGRTVSLHGSFEEMGQAYETAMGGLVALYGD